MTLIKQVMRNKNKNKSFNKSLSNMPKIKNTELKMNTPSRMLIRNCDNNKFIKNDNKVTEKTSEEEELLNFISNKHDKHGGDVLNINETIKSQEKTDRSSNLQSTRVNKKIMRSRIPRRRPVVTANKLTGFHSVTRIVVVKKNSRKIKVPSDPIITVTDYKSECQPIARLVEELNELDEYKIPESPELSPFTRKISLSSLSSSNNNSYFDDDADSDVDNDDCNDYEYSYDTRLHCSCESCINKYKRGAELLHQLKYKHWTTNDVLKTARYQSLSLSEEEEESSIESNSSPVFEKKIYRKNTREVYTSPKRSKQHHQLQEKNCTYSFLHIFFDIIFWPFLFFRKPK
ncbi:hypothetical protein G9C98_002386 [Cotesia typhae]|uniref:Uncharacterized protein n=1 Tax=Cotesia typhae TaxID=2053667 RepID=A0A8J5QV73_9HYME|nr:hypothetical protein G9C98_002386 [Cotesia typhae]